MYFCVPFIQVQNLSSYVAVLASCTPLRLCSHEKPVSPLSQVLRATPGSRAYRHLTDDVSACAACVSERKKVRPTDVCP